MEIVGHKQWGLVSIGENSMNVKPIILWSVPRSASTAFERYFIERGDMFVEAHPSASGRHSPLWLRDA